MNPESLNHRRAGVPGRFLHRTAQGLLAAILAMTAPTLNAQEAWPDGEVWSTRQPEQRTDPFATLEPLQYPTAPRSLRDLRIVLAPLGDEGRSLRFVHYLARLLERAGAGVGVATSVPDRERVTALCSEAQADLCLLVGAVGGGQDERSAAIGVVGRRDDELVVRLAKPLAEKFAERGVGELQAAPYGVGEPPEVPALYLRPRYEDVQTAHRPAVHASFEAIVAWWEAERESVRAALPKRRTTSPSDAVNPLWPRATPPASVAEMKAFVRNWRRSGVVDGSQVWFDAELVPEGDGWRLSGSTELPLLEAALRRALERVGVRDVVGALRPLPDEGRLGSARYAVVKAVAAQTWSLPGASTGLRGPDAAGQFEMSDLLRGEPVWLLDREEEHLLVHAASGYVGWVAEAALEICDLATFRSARDKHAPVRDRSGLGFAAAQRAAQRLGTPYLFGGRGPDGIDCSGLVSTAWVDSGVFLPRDARQQILAGRLVSTARRLEPMQPGDLLFFASGSGRISHVGISIGGLRFVHATPPEVNVGSLDPDSPEYVGSTAERFVLAKRPGR